MRRYRIKVITRKRTEWVEITSRIKERINSSFERGFVTVFVPHTTAGITINEHADPSVAGDMERYFDALVDPHESMFQHLEGNSAAHIKASLMGSSVRVAVEDSQLQLGQWQGIFFCEFDGPRNREVWLTLEQDR